MILLVEWKILTPLQKLPKNLGYLGKLFVAKGFKKLPNLVTLVITDKSLDQSVLLHKAKFKIILQNDITFCWKASK